MGLFSWMVLGLLAGFFGSKIVDHRGRGMVMDIVLGIVGAVVGGYVFSFVGFHHPMGLDLPSLGVATAGSVLTLSAAHFIRRT